MPTPTNPFEQPNDTPRDDFEGLTPRLMHGLLYDFLGPGSPVKVRDELPAGLTDRMPILNFSHRLLGELAEKEIKLTAKGNLPAKLVKTYYATGLLPDKMVEQGYSTIRGEDDFLPLQIVKHLLDILGWTKKRHNKLSLTKKGTQARTLDERELFRELFLVHAQRLNLAYDDRYGPEADGVQSFLPYMLYLLYLRGGQERPTAHYNECMWRAFPQLGGEENERIGWAVETRLLDRFLVYYGLVELSERNYRTGTPATVVATPLFREVFTLDPDARQAPPSEEERYEKQLQAALFDAEMGSQSWVSDHTPPELLAQFQANVREFEERQRAGETVPVGDLLGDLPLLPVTEMQNDEIAEREIARLLAALERVGILTDRPEELVPHGYYNYLVDSLLHHEVVPPVAGQLLFLSFEEVVLAGSAATELVTEGFLFALFDLDEPFPTEMLHTKMRLNNGVVSRERGLAHLNDWRSRYARIEPLAFELFAPPEDVPPLPPDRAVCFFGVEYRVHPASGRAQTFRGEGVAELVFSEDEGWRVSGGMFPGFEF
jgi:hypothetical protein